MAVFRFIYGLHGGPLHEVEDLTAETFLRAWRSRDRLNGGDTPALAWLLRTARHLVIDSYRRRRSRPVDTAEELTVLPDPAASLEERAMLGEQIKTL